MRSRKTPLAAGAIAVLLFGLCPLTAYAQTIPSDPASSPEASVTQNPDAASPEPETPTKYPETPSKTPSNESGSSEGIPGTTPPEPSPESEHAPTAPPPAQNSDETPAANPVPPTPLVDPPAPVSNAQKPLPAYGPTKDASALAAAQWLGTKLVAEGYVMGGQASPNWGATFDVILALAATGTSKSVIDEAMAILRSDQSYIGTAQAPQGSALSKTILTIEAAGYDPQTFYPNRDLVQELRGLVGESGQITGTNAFSHALGVLALARTESGAPQASIEWLKGRQCVGLQTANNGGFGYGGCSSADADFTGIITQALLAAGVSTSDPVIIRVKSYLETSQNADGSHSAGFGGTTGNGNSTGIAGQALAALGETGRAAASGNFVRSLQITCELQAGSPGGVPTAAVGAIAFNAKALRDALDSGTLSAQFLLATPQAVLALAGPSLGAITATGAQSAIPNVPCTQQDRNAPVHPGSYSAVTDPLTADAASWTGRDLFVNNGLLVNYGAKDWGLSLDAVISLAGAGVGKDVTDQAMDRFRNEGLPWIQSAPEGVTSRLAKAAYAISVQGHDPRDFFNGYDLVAELRAAEQSNGRLGVNTDTIGQAYGVLALARTAGGPSPANVNWLAGLACTDGGFSWNPDDQCTGVDADNTAIVTQALLAGGLTASDPSVAASLQWFISSQGTDGSFASWGAANTNSTALAAQTLRALGREAEAARAVEFIHRMWITKEAVAANAALNASDRGAVAYSSQYFTDTLSQGVASQFDSIQWSTIQAVMGAIRPLGEITARGAESSLPVTIEEKPVDPKPNPGPNPPATGTQNPAGGNSPYATGIEESGTGRDLGRAITARPILGALPIEIKGEPMPSAIAPVAPGGAKQDPKAAGGGRGERKTSDSVQPEGAGEDTGKSIAATGVGDGNVEPLVLALIVTVALIFGVGTALSISLTGQARARKAAQANGRVS